MNAGTTDPYARYLATLHRKLSTPDDVVDATVRRVTGNRITTRRRIIGGEANEVYEIGFADESSFIVRISRDKKKKFEQEHWAIEQCRRIGVPVPQVLWIEHLSSELGPLDICVQDKLCGRVLTATATAAMSREELKNIVGSVGECLSRIHTIRTEGVGYLDGSGRGGESPAAIGWTDADRRTLLDIAERSGFPQETMLRILDLSAAYPRPVRDPRLVHNDMRAYHIMVDGTRISGIIDWGEVSGEDPIQDFVHWDYWDGAGLPTAWLREGYGTTDLFADDFLFRLVLGQLDYGLCVLWWYHDRGFDAGVTAAQRKLIQHLGAATKLVGAPPS